VIIDITISDLGVISQATLPLGPGLTAVTGETGAGKTMVVTALGLLLGARADSARVRQGSTATWVEGRFQLDASSPVVERALELGAGVDDGELVLAREVQSEGRSRAVVGGRGAPVSALSELAEHLVVIHGQSDQIRLKSESAQRHALDRFAGAGLATVLERYQTAFHDYKDLEQRRLDLQASMDQRQREAQELRDALDDIAAVAPVAGEDVSLAESISRLTNTEDLRIAADLAKNALSADASSIDSRDASALLDEAVRALDKVVAFDPALEPIRAALVEAGYQISEATASLAGYLAGLESDGGLNLENSHQRLASLNNLVRRYGPTLDDVLELQRTGSDRLLELDTDGDTLTALTEQAEQALAKATSLAEELSQLRTKAATKLADAVTAELAALAMPNATLHVAVEAGDTLAGHGVDKVSILLAAHPGAEPLPLGKGASGGELSRVMLALEVVIAGSDPVPTFVFDEVDAGVGGASALEIGRRLDALAQTAQVIVVTHLAQVAAFANNHLRVVKDTDGQVTTSSVQALAGEERVVELARMLGGMSDSHTALSHARELIEKTHSVSRR
jgi:DNA repair protein RecN (Recombination protein N)